MSEVIQCEVAVLGGGPGGYTAAFRAADLGRKVVLIEKEERIGGVCLNVGCIPSKALLHASHSYHEAHTNFEKMGLMGGAPTVDMAKMIDYKQSVIDANVNGIEFLFKKNKVDYLRGWGKITGKGEVSVDGEVYKAKSIVIATGSEVAPLKGVEIDEVTVVSSTGALALTEVPKRMVVIGAGVIGLEMGSVYSRLGAEVTVVEFLDHVTPGMDAEIQKTLLRSLKKQGIKFILKAAVQSVTSKKGVATVNYKLRKDDSDASLEADIVLLATGRRPFTEGLGLEEMGIATSPRGQVETDGHWKTNVDGIYALGDVIDGPMLAHKAEDEGMAVAESLAGQAGHVIYTTPEVASVGKTEAQLKDEGRAYKVGKFSFMGNGRAKAVFGSEGFVKILADKETDRILGCHLMGPMAGELIHEICVAMEFGASAEDLARTCHAHPTFSEAVREAALACGDGAIHA